MLDGGSIPSAFIGENMKTGRTFGVELELNGMLHHLYDKIGFASNYDTVTRRHFDGYLEIELQPAWKVVYDGSCGCEFVSPPLVDTAPIMRQICAIRSSGFPIGFDDTGLHVHVGAHDLTRSNLIELAQFCRHFSKTIYSFVHPSRISGEYCRPMQLSDTNLKAEYDIKSRLGGGNSRYRGCNITSYDKHGTVEFRYSEGTLDYNKICALVDLFIKITDYVANNKGNVRVKSPRRREQKKRFLLNLVGVRDETRTVLLNTRY
jgi:hypothetical protein